VAQCAGSVQVVKQKIGVVKWVSDAGSSKIPALLPSWVLQTGENNVTNVFGEEQRNDLNVLNIVTR
jgi:hypothetical protein